MRTHKFYKIVKYYPKQEEKEPSMVGGGWDQENLQKVCDNLNKKQDLPKGTYYQVEQVLDEVRDKMIDDGVIKPPTTAEIKEWRERAAKNDPTQPLHVDTTLTTRQAGIVREALAGYKKRVEEVKNNTILLQTGTELSDIQADVDNIIDKMGL